MRAVNYLGAAAVFALGLYTVLTRRNIVKIAMGLSLMEAAGYLLLLSMAYRAGSTAPTTPVPFDYGSPAELGATAGCVAVGLLLLWRYGNRFGGLRRRLAVVATGSVNDYAAYRRYGGRVPRAGAVTRDGPFTRSRDPRGRRHPEARACPGAARDRRGRWTA